MSNTWFSSDLHLDHKGIIKFRDFGSVEEHNAIIKDNYHKVVKPRDRVYLTGDVAFSKEALEDLKTWSGTKILICGNHDLERGITMKDLCDVYDEVYAFKRWREFWLSHCPIHPEELRGKYNLHGHCHSHIIDDPRYLNLCLEHHNYMPIDINFIRDHFRGLE